MRLFFILVMRLKVWKSLGRRTKQVTSRLNISSGFFINKIGSIKKMERLFLNWKTSLAGLIAGIGQYLMVQGNTGFTWESFVVAIPTLLIGLFSKDK